MRFLRFPACLETEIHAVDINADNSMAATSTKDGAISIWSLAELTQWASSSPESSSPSSVPPISPLQSYTRDALVSIVRWSPKNADTLASGDANGHIYLNNDRVYPFSASTTADCSPVVDLSWSNDGRLIAWSTTNGQTNVIDIERKTYQEISVLAHLEVPTIQRSVAFDPSNNYLVTLSDDTLIYLYQYTYDNEDSDGYRFRLINKISRLINKHPLNVHYKRISWSPDGELVSIPTASKNQTSLISLVSRSKGWSNRISLVGHGLTCEVVKFNPRIFNASQSDNDNIYNVLATAGSDRNLTVWNTSKDTPIFLLQEVVGKPITDVCWDRNGTSLLLTSLDGYLGILSFEPNELGYEVSPEVVAELNKFEKEFVKPLNHKYEHDQPAGRRSNASQIEILDQKDAVSIEKQDSIMEESEDTKVSAPLDAEVVTKKTKIEPEVIPAPSMDDVTSDILVSAMTTRKKKNDKEKEKTVKVEEKEKIEEKVKEKTLEKQKVSTKNGKKRIQPLLISNGNETSTTEPVTNGTSTTDNKSTKSLMEFDKPSFTVSDDFYKENKRLKSQDELTASKKVKRELVPVKYIGSPIVNPNTAFAKVRLAVPKVRLGFQLPSKKEESFILDIKNGSGNETKPSRVTYFKKEKQIWVDFIPQYIQLATEGSTFWALATSDGQVLTYSHTSGKRLLPPIVLGSSLSFFESHNKYLMAVTSLGELYVWNLETKKKVLLTNLSPLLELNNRFQEDGLSKSDNITMCSITSLGIPLITLSNGSGYLYNQDLSVWQTITESWWSFGSHFWDSNDETKQSKSALFSDDPSIIELMENKTNEEIIRKSRTGRGKYINKISKNMIMKEGFENLENTISISHLENKILCCELLGENKDFHRHFITYVKRVCELGFKAKLFEVCNFLLGPQEEDEVVGAWDPKICGLDKHELLKEVILACASNRDTQRILIHFSNKIGLMNGEE